MTFGDLVKTRSYRGSIIDFLCYFFTGKTVFKNYKNEWHLCLERSIFAKLLEIVCLINTSKSLNPQMVTSIFFMDYTTVVPNYGESRQKDVFVNSYVCMFVRVFMYVCWCVYIWMREKFGKVTFDTIKCQINLMLLDKLDNYCNIWILCSTYVNKEHFGETKITHFLFMCNYNTFYPYNANYLSLYCYLKVNNLFNLIWDIVWKYFLYIIYIFLSIQ